MSGGSPSERKALLKVCLSWRVSLFLGQAVPAAGWEVAEHVAAWPLMALVVTLVPFSE